MNLLIPDNLYKFIAPQRKGVHNLPLLLVVDVLF